MSHITNNNVFHIARTLSDRSSGSSDSFSRRSSFDRTDPFKTDPFENRKSFSHRQGHSVRSVSSKKIVKKKAKFDYMAWRKGKWKKSTRGPVARKGPLRGR